MASMLDRWSRKMIAPTRDEVEQLKKRIACLEREIDRINRAADRTNVELRLHATGAQGF